MASNTIEAAAGVKVLETVEIQVECSKETSIEAAQVAKEIPKDETLNNTTITPAATMDAESHAGHVRTVEELGDEPAVGPPPTKKVRVDKKSNKKADKKMQHCSPEDVQWQDIVALLGKDVVDQAIESETEFSSPFEKFEELEVKVVHMCSNGRPWVLVIPFCFPGETVRVKVHRHERLHSLCDLLEVVEPNLEIRDESLVKCKYFRTCGGCQSQMVSYENQLKFKRNVVLNAYKRYSKLPDSEVPEILPTIGSPLQYGYRTKITPHFQLKSNGTPGDPFCIGFNDASRTACGRHRATPVLNETLPIARKKIHDTLSTFKKGSTLLLRESLNTNVPLPLSSSLTPDELADAMNTKICITNNNASVRERVDNTFFEFNGGSFFQNNNSILPTFTQYIREAIFPPDIVSKPTHLIDTYCGAGLFALTLAPYFDVVSGIELSADSIMYAKRNARLNNIPSTKCSFRKGDAANIFDVVKEFPPEHTAVVIDPPRKGTDMNFINQLVGFLPQTVVYARDIGLLLRAVELDSRGKKYVLESLRGFDLFPQTSHVESVAN
ncbi:S-adenosyl-L-methionine-dependent methyltransferase [Armillaria luteobubalina]|uniref:S-adenosyl-L-methionine-dependent methyltransferase n=1 Tax=Armillaria luteobubalina TaxID=153913 RepID=A0AA39TY46_9AGAR|nr:S-adenosyl-L-methionine-dependent methyltransferase [Armillaria luteobubalina]